MTDTNFDLAPPAKTVDGLLAVPIDVQRITANLTFDGATKTGQGDATLEFTMGPQSGNPIFDLRQTIIAVWLDGTSLSVTKLAHHDFGGGAHSELRIVEAMLAAGSTHTLRVTYSLGTPQASTAGSYPPSMTWSNGPRLAFNFGFTDMGAGRYLEAWAPANLIFDQFELLLELMVLNTTVTHTIITNGEVATLGANHWRVNFPSRFTALSPLLELRANDTLESANAPVLLPVSSLDVMIEAWKLASSSIDLATQVDNLKSYLANNENSTGPYMHGNRFVAFIHMGGMEYEGGTTSSTDALKHETFHSWWARGIKPASQPDAWFDEAWAEYNDYGASQMQPFNFSDPPVALCPRNPWVRITASNAYSDGYQFWKGIAALIGVNKLKILMSEIYRQRSRRPVTTTDIEEFLICNTGNVQLVDAFHRFVYGFENPSSTPDLWIRDDPGHAGNDPWSGRFWDSPDLWVRNLDDGEPIPQSTEFGQDNWIYARVHNRGMTKADHFVVTFNIKEFAGTQFTYPNDFLPCIAAASGFDLESGGSMIVKARWPKDLVPPPGNHSCLLAAVLTKGDQPLVGCHVWEHNNLAQKNLTIVDLKPDNWLVLPFVVSNLHSLVSKDIQLVLIRPKDHIRLEASLIHSSQTVFRRTQDIKIINFDFSPSQVDSYGTGLDCLGYIPPKAYLEHGVARIITSDKPELLATQFKRGVEVIFGKGALKRIPISVSAQEQLTFGLKLRTPKETKKGDKLCLDLIQRDGKRTMGGIAIQINVV